MTKQYYLYCLFVFVTSSEGAKIYIIDTTEEKIDRNPVNTNQIRIESNLKLNSNEENGRSHLDAFINQIISLLDDKRIKHSDTKKRTCDKYSGNIFGTKLQKLQCLYDLYRGKDKGSIKRTDKRYLKYYFDSDSDREYYDYPKYNSKVHKDKHEFNDLTRGDSHHEKIANDYLDIQDFARDSSESIASIDDNLRDFRPDTDIEHNLINTHSKVKDIRNPKKNRINQRSLRKTDVNLKANNVFRATTDESSSSTESEEKQRKKYVKPKRFQVIKNSESNESGPKPVASATESDSSTSEEVPRKKHKKVDKKVVKKPSSSDLNDKYVYMQGRNRQFGGNAASDSDFDSASRKRLQHFLPKRFHWNETDMPELGYFWFNGIKGN